MAGAEKEPEFNTSRAELFEALGHPIRIKILQALEQRPMGFAELKKATGIESSGHLSFHLTKLEGLVKSGNDGAYSLTDEGKEALHVVSVTRGGQGGRVKVTIIRPSLKMTAVVIGLATLVLLGAIVVVQQQQIGNLSRQESQVAQGTVLINGTRYTYVEVPLEALTYPAVFRFDGVTFNMTPGKTGPFEVTFVSPSPSPRAGSNATVTMPITVTVRNVTSFGSVTLTIQIAPLPSVRVTFSDGTSEIYNQSGSTVSSSQSAVGTWFSQHSNPRAGVMWDSASNSYYLYVGLES